MDKDTVLKDLRRLRRLNADIDVLKRTIQRLREVEDMYKSFNCVTDEVEREIKHFEDIYTSTMQRCIATKRLYAESLNNLPPFYRAVAIDTYVNGRRIEDIAAAYNYSEATIKRTLAKAVEMIAESRG